MSAFIQANPSLKPQIDVMLSDISKDPFVDLKTKFWFPVPPVVLTICYKDNIWAIFHCDNCNSVAKLYGMGVVGDKPTIR